MHGGGPGLDGHLLPSESRGTQSCLPRVGFPAAPFLPQAHLPPLGLHLRRCLEDLLHRPGDQACRIRGAPNRPLHGVGLATACLTIGEDADVIPIQGRLREQSKRKVSGGRPALQPPSPPLPAPGSRPPAPDLHQERNLLKDVFLGRGWREDPVKGEVVGDVLPALSPNVRLQARPEEDLFQRVGIPPVSPKKPCKKRRAVR